MMIIDVKNFDEFKSEVLDSNRVVFIDFWAPWCPPCRAFGPIFDEFSTLSNDYKCIKINVDEYNGASHEYKVMNIPTVLISKNGEIAHRVVGVQSISSLNEIFDKLKG